MEPREIASLMLGINRNMLTNVVDQHGEEAVVAILRAMAGIIERGMFKPDVMH